jgi:hypothetical protein
VEEEEVDKMMVVMVVLVVMVVMVVLGQSYFISYLQE